MYSNIKRTAFSFILVVIAVIGINMYLDYKAKGYEVYLGNSVIGYTKNKDTAKNNYKQIIDDLNNKLSENEAITKKILRFKRIHEEVSSSEYNEFERNILNTISDKVTLKAIIIDNKKIGYVIDKADMEDALIKVSEIYAKKNELSKDKIVSVNVKGNIKLKDEVVSVSKLNGTYDLANKIMNINKDMIYVDLIINDKKVVNIEPSVKIERTDDMLIGESKVKEGKVGKKEQHTKVTYRNGEKISTEVLSEKIIKNSISKVVYKGTKNPITSNKAFLMSPTRGGMVTSSFGERWGRNHNGMDIAGNMGDPIVAAIDGVVKSIFYEKNGYGNVVILEHEDGIETRYAHMSKSEVKEGDKVKKGDLIGRVGNTGRSTGPHLHFEVRINGSPVDPQNYLK
ncbi:peptidoglycan DD-metalloendopeptidase family protein [Eubacterium multiforme]|uniref:Murein DD-endopeptidase MepM/ murein hydrolase activator NlpD n=1 Tax=Eubacterium multiforme TaxID=83339 RepID=A0ABT9UY71_9FIRM|nr:peptidoglycan DD-metalloendopeptidase family protein [Eubacterium multiforme]MDQ0151263.1 murein DD-endopeptidase MepM/ murein hydrolase activator NlpD [Eubacterium multiforme]